MGNNIERTALSDDRRRAVLNRNINELPALSPPDLEYASGVVALDGTLEEITAIHDEQPGVVTTSTAEESLPIAEDKHFGNVLGSNEFETKRVGTVIRSNHYGDGYIKKCGA